MDTTSTAKPSLLKVLLAIVKHNLLFMPDLPYRLEQDNMPAAYKLTPWLHVRPAMRVDEPGPIAGFLCIDHAGLRYLEVIERGARTVLAERSQIANVFVEILAFLDAYTGLDERAIAQWPWASDLNLVRDELLSERPVTANSALGLIS